MQSQFKIEAWDAQEPVQALSHRHQLKPLQQIITKAKTVRKPLLIQSKKVNQEIKDEHSQVSSKGKHRKYYTEEIYRKRSSKIIEQSKEKAQKQNSIISRNAQYKTQQSSIVGLSRFKQDKLASGFDFDPQPKQFMRHVKELKQPIERGLGRVKSEQKRTQEKAKKTIEQTRKGKCCINIKSQSCLVILPNFNDRNKNKLKSFFLQDINKKQGQKSLKSQQALRKQKKQQEKPDTSNRWHYMIEKSNKRKKQLEELFKTRPLFGKKHIERRIAEFNLSTLLKDEMQKISLQKTSKNEFDDNTLYCSWSYREQKKFYNLTQKQQQR